MGRYACTVYTYVCVCKCSVATGAYKSIILMQGQIAEKPSPMKWVDVMSGAEKHPLPDVCAHYTATMQHGFQV